MSQSSLQLPIDECEEWIWDILDCTRDCGFEYISGDGKEFLILNTNDFYADTKALYKIKGLMGIWLMQKYAQWQYSALVFQAATYHIG